MVQQKSLAYRPPQYDYITRTGRHKGKQPTVVTKYVLLRLRATQEVPVLDFGAGAEERQLEILEANGWTDLSPFDYSVNFGETYPQVIHRLHSLVMVSNVLNVQPSVDELRRTLRLVAAMTQETGLVVCNYPTSPRLTALKPRAIEHHLKQVFRYVQKVPKGVTSGDLWECSLRGLPHFTGLRIAERKEL